MLRVCRGCDAEALGAATGVGGHVLVCKCGSQMREKQRTEAFSNNLCS